MGLVPLIAMIALGVLVLVSTVPVPLWVARALRGRRRRALPPAPVDAGSLEGLGPALADVVVEARMVRGLLEAALDAADDVASVFLFVRISQAQADGRFWGDDVRNAYESRVSDAVRAVGEWIAAVRALPEADQQVLARKGLSLQALQAVIVGETALAPYDPPAIALRFGSLRRADLEDTRRRFTAASAELQRFEDTLLGSVGSPYR